MERLACVNVAAFPLQLLLCAHPDWRTQPAAVVEDDRVQALVLYANSRARRAGVRAGQRYVTSLTIERHLCAGVISSGQIDEGIRALTDRLRRYSPHVEPAADVPGVFWLDVQGLDRLYPSLDAWATDVRADLQRAGLWSSVAVGFSRLGVYALANARRDVTVCASAGAERAAVRSLPLDCLDLDPQAREDLLALGVTTIGDFLRLPAEGIRTRFGAAAGLLHQLASGRRTVPLVPVPVEEIHERVVDFDAPERHAERLLFVVKRLIDELIGELAHRALAVSGLALHLMLDNRTTRLEEIRPASPTLDVAQLVTLVRLRFDTLRLTAGIVAIRLVANVSPATADQQRLFAVSRRATDAANQALARLGAECGERSVVRAHLCEAHLPAARFRWEPLRQVPERAAPRVMAARPFVRRIYTTPVSAAPAISSAAPSRVGPYVVSGGWWAKQDGRGVRRDYYYVLSARGDLLWVYYDHERQRFFLQGSVE